MYSGTSLVMYSDNSLVMYSGNSIVMHSDNSVVMYSDNSLLMYSGVCEQKPPKKQPGRFHGICQEVFVYLPGSHAHLPGTFTIQPGTFKDLPGTLHIEAPHFYYFKQYMDYISQIKKIVVYIFPLKLFSIFKSQSQCTCN